MKEHILEHHVPYADVDQMGFVYYANYLVYFEMGRSAMLRDLGLPYGKLEEMGVMLPVLESHVEYKKPAGYEDLISIKTTCLPFVKSRLRIEHEITRDGELIASGYTQHVCMTPEGRPKRPAKELVELICG